jgi:hypothetical protein
MSEYGRVWERAANVRRELQALLPELTGNYTPDDAKRLAREQGAALVAKVDVLAEQWRRIEEELKRTPG